MINNRIFPWIPILGIFLVILVPHSLHGMLKNKFYIASVLQIIYIILLGYFTVI